MTNRIQQLRNGKRQIAKRTGTKRTGTKRTGAVAVEMALTIPLLLFIVFSSYEFARANMIRHTVESAAYEGARQGILPGANEQEVLDATNFVLSTIRADAESITVTPSPLTNDATEVEVTIRVELRDNMLFIPFFLREGVVERTCTMAREELF